MTKLEGNGTFQACRAIPYYEFGEGLFEIDEFDCGSIFVIVGEKRALLIDTGTGIGDLKWVLENRITNKPYDVVVSHNHGDHLGGAGWFDSVYIHPEDMDLNDPSVGPNIQFRRNYAEIIRIREHKNYSYDTEKDIREWPKTPNILPLKDGQTFDLGGRIVTAYHCPGHTAGEMVFIDDKTRTLFCGDAFNGHWMLNDKFADTALKCKKIALAAMQRIYDMRNLYDAVYNFHHDYRGFGSPLADDTILNLIQCLNKICNGTMEFEEIPDPLSKTGESRVIAKYKNVIISNLFGRIDME